VLQKRVPATLVVQIGPAVQALLALVVTMATVFTVWEPAAAVFVAIQIFTHTFAFGLLARLDPSGRAVAATPAMLMIGAALGPIIGGMLGEHFGFGTLGLAAVLVAFVSITFFTKAKSA
jgi:predicted MFS family arabinose efflux permease